MKDFLPMIDAIKNAIESLAGSLPDACSGMRHGLSCGAVISVSSRQLSGETLSADAPQEIRRFTCKRSDFPDLKDGAVVEIGDDLHIVTSARTDAVGASLVFGVSDVLDRAGAIYSGVRRENDVARKFRHPINLFAIRVSEAPPDLSDSAAFSYEQSWVVCIAADVWPETFGPQASDTIEFTDPKRAWETVRLKVSSVVQHSDYWMLRARPRGGM